MCQQQLACLPMHVVQQWECHAKPTFWDFDLRCLTIHDQEICAQQAVCDWLPWIVPDCHVGMWVPCRPVSNDDWSNMQEVCAVQAEDACSQQLACKWQQTYQCQCPYEAFGEWCENNISVWSGSALCDQTNSDIETCNGIVHGALLSAEDVLCVAHEGCGKWHRAKGLTGLLCTSQLTTLICDYLGHIPAMVAIAGYQKGLFGVGKVWLWWGLFWQLVVFIVDLVGSIVTAWAATKALPLLSKIAGSYCFEGGPEFLAIATLQDAAFNMILLSALQIAAAFLGVVLDCWEAFDENQKEADAAAFGTPARTIAAMIIVVLMQLVQLIVGAIDFANNGSQFAADLRAIDKEVLGLALGNRIGLCVGLNAAMENPRLQQIPIALDVIWAVPVTQVVLMMLTAWICRFRVDVAEVARAVSAALVQLRRYLRSTENFHA